MQYSIYTRGSSLSMSFRLSVHVSMDRVLLDVVLLFSSLNDSNHHTRLRLRSFIFEESVTSLNNLIPSTWLWCVVCTLKTNRTLAISISDELFYTHWTRTTNYMLDNSLPDEAVLPWALVWFPILQFERIVQWVLCMEQNKWIMLIINK